MLLMIGLKTPPIGNPEVCLKIISKQKITTLQFVQEVLRALLHFQFEQYSDKLQQ